MTSSDTREPLAPAFSSNANITGRVWTKISENILQIASYVTEKKQKSKPTHYK